MINMKFKKFASLLLGLTVSLSVSTTAFAADTSSKSTVSNSQIVHSVNSKSNPIKLKDGEHVKIPLKLEKSKVSTPNKGVLKDVFEGDGGSVDISRSGDQVYYKVSVDVETTGFLGYVSITDVTSGINAGFGIVNDFEGSVSYTEFSNHSYSASIDGTAFDGVKPVATTADNLITWTCE